VKTPQTGRREKDAFMLYLRDQQYMIALEHTGSFSAAARELRLSQPALSKWLTALESRLGQKLVIRNPEGIYFTEAGLVYLDGCKECLKEFQTFQEGLHELKEHPKETIMLGGSYYRGIHAFAGVYSPFRDKYPDIELNYTAGSPDQLRSEILSGDIQLAMMESTASSASDPDIDFLKLNDEELLLFLPKGHSLSYDMDALPTNSPWPVLDLKKLAGTPILAGGPHLPYANEVRRLYQEAGLTDQIIFHSDITALLYDMVRNGVGASLLPDAYFRTEDGLSVYTLSPRIYIYQGIALKKNAQLTKAEEFLIHLLMNEWKTPFYIHQYIDYTIQQRREKLHLYEHSEV
jgi:LysR family hca operon transcriptional activator